jgi:small GTP-binding protein
MAEPLKVVLLGETGVGKTSIISQFTTHTFDPHRETSLSAQFISKTVDFQDLGQSVKFDIWDTVGQEKYRSLAKIFYKDAKVIIFVYDITREITFEGLKNYWYDETKNNTDGEPILAVVANKIDLYANSKVSNNDGKAFADQIGAIFQTTSALSDSGISTLFDNVGKKYLIPGYDYQSEDKQAQEQFLKKKKENEGKNKPGRNKKVNENKGVKLEQNENKQKSKKGWC